MLKKFTDAEKNEMNKKAKAIVNGQFTGASLIGLIGALISFVPDKPDPFDHSKHSIELQTLIHYMGEKPYNQKAYLPRNIISDYKELK
jgi:hypothetical protein